jgi:iron complex outermembrane receptor protein
MKKAFLAFLLSAFSILLFAQTDNKTADIEKQKLEKAKAAKSKEIIIKGKQEQPGVVTVIDEKAVKDSTKTDLVNVIKENVPSFYTPGNRVMGFGVSSGGSAVMSIRGIGKSGWGPTTGVPFLINGLDTTTSIMGHPIADIFTMKNIDRIEVLHGSQPVLYGSGALGGIINIITKRQESEGYSTDLSLSYGTYNSTDDYVMHQGKIGGFDYGISYNFQKTDGHRDQETPNGTKVTSEYMNQNGTIRFGYELNENWYAGMNAYAMKEEIHDPGQEGAATNNLETFYILRDGISLNILNNYNMLEGMIHLFYNNGHHEAEKPALNTDSYEHDDYLYGTRIIESVKLFEGNKITAGVDIRKWGGTAKNLQTDTYYVDDKFLTDSSVFGLIEQRFFKAFTLSGGARYTDDSKYGGFTAWQGGLIINPLNWFKIHSSVAEGFKLPDLRQLYIKMYGAEVPNENLKPETFTSYDAGIELNPIDNLTMDFTGYKIYAEDKIMKSGNYWVNADKFDYKGAEVSAKYKLLDMIGLKAGYSYIDNEYDNLKLTYVPKHKFNGAVSFEKWGLFAGVDCEYVKDVYDDDAGTKKLSDYTVFNGKVAYTFLEHYRAFVNLCNIGDKDYETFYKYPMPGFTVMGGISASL